MHIIELRAENVKRLTAVKVRPDGALVQVVGKNAQGKSSVLDSIWMALDWAHSSKPSEPIRRGAKEAIIKLDMGEIKVTRTFRKTGKDELATELRIESAAGANISSPQKFLDTLIGSLSFNPLEFMEGDDKAKYDALKSFVPGVDFDEIAAINQTDFAKRTDENRKAKELIAQAAGIMVPEGKHERIDVTKVVADLEAAEQTNREIESRRTRRKLAEEQIETGIKNAERLKARAEQLMREIKDLGVEADEQMEAVEKLRKRLTDAEALPEEIDTAALRSKITEAQTVNANAENAARKAALLTQADQHEKASQALTDAMQARSEDVRAKIAAAEMPVPGLSLEEGKVLLKGLPLDQASTAEMLKLSIAVAMAKNPKARVILIREGGNDLDADSMKIVAEMAESFGGQVWVERIHAEGGPPAIIMEDGHAKE